MSPELTAQELQEILNSLEFHLNTLNQLTSNQAARNAIAATKAELNRVEGLLQERSPTGEGLASHLAKIDDLTKLDDFRRCLYVRLRECSTILEQGGFNSRI